MNPCRGGQCAAKPRSVWWPCIGWSRPGAVHKRSSRHARLSGSVLFYRTCSYQHSFFLLGPHFPLLLPQTDRCAAGEEEFTGPVPATQSHRSPVQNHARVRSLHPGSDAPQNNNSEYYTSTNCFSHQVVYFLRRR